MRRQRCGNLQLFSLLAGATFGNHSSRRPSSNQQQQQEQHVHCQAQLSTSA